MRWFLFALFLFPAQVLAQSKTVLPSEATVEVIVEENTAIPFTREMVLLTIRGVYGRHITREELVQPDLEGFSWAQLGPDNWTEQRINGRKFKVFERQMALYPVEAGELTIGPFIHRLTLTDENDDWFAHEIASQPLTIRVSEAPVTDGWWFPVRELKISDQWSNAPDQLSPGEGVLRVIRLEALGATPEMIPPMPELRSPSALIFAHPEKRLVELTPEGPVTYAFWRWTIRPSNDTSGIVEPLEFEFFDTVARELREVTISPQRVAYGSVTTDRTPETQQMVTSAVLPSWTALLPAVAVFVIGVVLGMSGRRIELVTALQRFAMFDPLVRALWRNAKQGRVPGVRRAAAAILRRDGPSKEQSEQIQALDRQIFALDGKPPDLIGFARRFLGH